MVTRQGLLSSSEAATTTADVVSLCASTTLPMNGVLSFAGAAPTTLAADALYVPACAGQTQPAIIANAGYVDETSAPSDIGLSDFRDPFYASIFPQCYALAATTVLAYVLFTMLIIVPRSFLDGGVVVLGRRGFTNGPSNGISIGGRPWLQKVAALTVTISLTIATADTFRVAEEQYRWGIQNATRLQAEVLGGTQLKSIQLISDTFLWLAQAQTLIRLFPRQREKIIIKWTAFSLITLDVIFGALNSFHYTGQGQVRPRNFTDAVPALSYLFQLSLGLLYAAWVIYYSFMKKRYAFYHPLMKNICLMAFLSIISILVPVVFFILDIAEPEFTGWGEYVRWVGAAAASVVVWEWVERIEALEREEKKDGILGREIFDGDEMMDISPSDLSWPRRRKSKKNGDDEDGGESGQKSTAPNSQAGNRGKMWPAMSSIASRYKARAENGSENQRQQSSTGPPSAGHSAARLLQPPLWLSRPPPAVTPVSRTDTASADSTVYAVRYQPLTETTSRTTDERAERPASRSESIYSPGVAPLVERDEVPISPTSAPRQPEPAAAAEPVVEPAAEKAANGAPGRWRYLAHFNPFHDSSHAPPAEIIPHTKPKERDPKRNYENSGRWNFRGRIEDFTANHAERIMERVRGTPDTENLPITVIPAPPRRGAALAQLLEEEAKQNSPASRPQLSISTPQQTTMRSASNTSGSSPLSPTRILSHSSISNASRPILSPGERSEVFQLRPANTADSLSPTAPRGADQREYAAPRPVHGRQAGGDIIRTTPPP